jgi:glutamate 5-kinase
VTRAELRRCRRVVVKIGSSLLAPPQGGVHARRFAQLARDVTELIEQGRQIVLVSSGAVALGLRRLGIEQRPRSIPEKQAAAAVGQIDLCRRYQIAFQRRGLRVGQILLDHVGLADRERFLNARHTLNQLLASRAVPIINENDSVATEELRFGDNDHLSALVTNVAGAELLVLLTDIDAFYDRPPHEPGAQRVAEVGEVTNDLLERTGPTLSGVGTGGMRSKLKAARTAAHFGAATVIADGRRTGILQGILAGDDVGTLVKPSSQQISSRKHWIAYSLKPRGKLHLDAGATRALREGKRSLLPIGVVAVEGRFGVGDLVSCLDPSAGEIARGLISYKADDVERIKGQKSPRIHELLGYSNGDEIIHRDDLVLL